MRVLWLADVLRDAGLTVVEHDGWRTRGWEPWAPRFGIVHATAAPRTQSDATQVAIVRDGHSELQGPIANAVVDRSGRWHVVASGQCNTALTGWAGPAEGLGNTHLLGVEACNDNRTEPWPDVQYEAYTRGWAAICRRMEWGAGRCVGHKEHQPGNKSDPTFDMDRFRDLVARLIEEDDVAARDVWMEPIKRVSDGRESNAASLLRYANEWSRRADQRTDRLVEEAAAAKARDLAILEKLAGTDASEIVAKLDAQHTERLAQLEQVRTQVLDRLDSLELEHEEIAELVRQGQSGEMEAAEVVRLIGDKLTAQTES